MPIVPNWPRLEAERQRAAQDLYDRDVVVEEDEDDKENDDAGT